MNRIYISSESPEDWQKLLASPEKHWKTGFSAKALAFCWEEAKGFPKEIQEVFKDTEFEGMEPLFIIPEYPVALPGGKRPSYNDIYVLAKVDDQLVCVMIEGIVSESFGERLDGWDPDSTPGRRERFDYIVKLLGLDPEEIQVSQRYQLFHRTASAVVEAKRLGVNKAIMLVHSFSQELEHFKDYKKFLELFSVKAMISQLHYVNNLSGVDLYLGWVVGEKKYLKK